MKKFFCAILRFFNLVDRSCNLSITNIAVIVIITKIALAPLDWASAATLLMALLNYGHKRYESNKATKEEEAFGLQIITPTPELVDLAPLKEEIASLKASQEAVNKIAADTQKLLSQSNVAAAFAPRTTPFVPRSKRNE